MAYTAASVEHAEDNFMLQELSEPTGISNSWICCLRVEKALLEGWC